MNDSIQQSIAALEGEQHELDARRQCVGEAIAALRRLVDGHPPKARRGGAKRGRPAKREAQAITAAEQEAIVDRLRLHEGSMRSGSLATVLKISTTTLRRRLAPLLEAKRVRIEGATANRRIVLEPLEGRRRGREAESRPTEDP